jgi:pseudouridine-5'-phosphate glycosidase
MALINRAGPRSVALETTLLVHGVPAGQGGPLAAELAGIVRQHGAQPAIIGVVAGQPIAGLTDQELATLLDAPQVPKANTANLGILIHQGSHAATTVSATMEIAASSGIRVFATGGLGGVHEGYGTHLDISADLLAFTRFPVAVVCSGVKSILDVESTRELLETLGVPVVGFRTDTFPAFYLRDSSARVDASFDDVEALAGFIVEELARTNRGVVIANPIPQSAELPKNQWDRWLAGATALARGRGVSGRDLTPLLLAHLHEASGGKTLEANLALVRANAALAADLCRRLPR